MKISTCPSCGRPAMERIVAAVTFQVRGKKTSIPDVPHFLCRACGQRLFDRESDRVLDARRGRRARRAA